MLAISLGLLLVTADAARAITYSWNVASGDWFTPGNWSPSGPPGAGDDAVISNGGTCTLDAAASVTNFTLSSGVLNGSGTLTVTGTTSWSGGQMAGTGTTATNGGLSISGASTKFLDRALNSNSAATWMGSGNFNISSSGALNIAASTTFDVQNDQTLGTAGGSPAINNAGTFQKSAGTGTTTVAGTLPFNNTGSVLVQTGTLRLGDGTSTGSFDSTGGTLDFAFVGGGSAHTLSSAASITGGDVTFSGGTVNHAGSYNVSGTTTGLPRPGYPSRCRSC